MSEPIKLPSWIDLDLLVDTDPLELRNAAWRMRCEVDRLSSERDKAVTSVKHTANAMLKAATAMQEAARLAAAAGAVDVVAVLSDVLMDVDQSSAVQVEPGGASRG